MEFPTATAMKKAVAAFVMPEAREIVVYGNEVFVCGSCNVKEAKRSANDAKKKGFSMQTMPKHQQKCIHFQMCVRGHHFHESKSLVIKALRKRKVRHRSHCFLLHKYILLLHKYILTVIRVQRANTNYARSENGKRKGREATKRFAQKSKSDTAAPSSDAGAASSRVMTRGSLANALVREEVAVVKEVPPKHGPDTPTVGKGNRGVLTRAANARVREKVAVMKEVPPKHGPDTPTVGQGNIGVLTRAATIGRHATEFCEKKTAAPKGTSQTKQSAVHKVPGTPKTIPKNVSQVTTRRSAMGVVTRRKAMCGRKEA
jgi:hypothetical protein